MDTTPDSSDSGLLPDEVEDALADALETGALQDGGFVDDLCARFPACADRIRTTVEALLALDALTVGDAIGPYRIERRLGQGGMGTVFLARQEEPVQREVALKVVKTGMNSAEVVVRFQQERQALAWMHHDGIAKVFDCGATKRGQPYFVMEYVDGVALTEYCDTHRLTIPQRVELMVQVCAAVMHAHQKGVVHRDLKPSNVLVCREDGRARVKIIDFGLAKVVAGTDQRGSIPSLGRAGVGTPEYMAPEQADPELDVDTRADVYSLGAVLYELLTGCLPLASERLRGNQLRDVGRILENEVPERPSSRIRSSDGAATARGAPQNALVRVLRRDLDWVALKALEKDRNRRYPTVSALADDLRRFLAHEPIEAGPPSFRYRLQKAVRKHRGPVVAAALVLLALIGGAVATFVQYLRAEDEATLATAAKVEALEVAGFLEQQWEGLQLHEVGATLRSTLLDQLDAAQRATFESDMQGVNFSSLGLEMLATNLFDRSLATIERDFADRPGMKARLLQSVATTLRAVGLVDRALPPQTEALAIRRQTLAADDPLTLWSVHEMAALLHARNRDVVAAEGDAERLYREALAGRRRVLGDDARETIHTRNNLGVLLTDKGEWQEAEDLLLEAERRARATLGLEDELTLAILGNIGRLAYRRGDATAVEEIYRAVLDATRRSLGDDHHGIVIPIMNLGALLQEVGELEEAGRLLTEARDRSKELLGDDHPTTLAVERQYAEWLHSTGQVNAAGQLFRRVAADLQRVLPADHPEIFAAIHSLAHWHEQQHDFATAKPLYEEAVRGKRAILGDTHPDTLDSVNNLGNCLIQLDELDQAEPLLRETFEVRHRQLGPGHAYTRISGNNLAMLLQRQGKLSAAEVLLRQLVADAERELGKRNPDVLMFALNFGYCLYKLERFDDAEPVFRDALTGCREVFGPADYNTVDATHLLGLVLVDTGRFDAARALFAGTEAAARAAYVPGRPHRLADYLAHLGIALHRQDRPDFAGANARLEEAYRLFVASRGADHNDTIEVIRALVAVHTSWEPSDPNGGHAAAAARWRQQLPEGR